MREIDVDRAFEWWITIVGIILAILNQYPEYFYAVTTQPWRPLPLRVAIGVVPPMVVTTMVWLVGKLSSRNTVQASAKIVAWMCLVGVMGINLIFYLMGVMIASGSTLEEAKIFVAPPLMLGVFLFIPVFTHFIVTPRYRDAYPDVSFLKSNARLLILYATITIFLFFLIVGTH